MSAWIFPLLGVAIGLAASFTGLGGGFVVVPLLIALGFTPQRAVGTSFAAILLVGLSSLFGHAKLAEVEDVLKRMAGELVGPVVSAGQVGLLHEVLVRG